MARRKQHIDEATGALMPKEFLNRDQSEKRRAWFKSAGLMTWAEQNAATKLARRTHRIHEPEPREWFRQFDPSNERKSHG